MTLRPVFVFTTLEVPSFTQWVIDMTLNSDIQPFLKPLLKSATSSLSAVSGEVIDTHDQYEVFNDPRAVRLGVFFKSELN